MIRILHILKEMGRNLKRHPGTALGSLLSLTLLFLLFDLFWVGAGTSDQFYREILSELRMEAFISEEVPDSVATALVGEVYAIPGLQSAVYISRDSARVELAGRLGVDLLVGYDSLNPLPRSLILTLEDEALNTGEMNRIEESLRTMPEIDDVAYSRHFLDKAESTRDLILQVGFILGALILLTALMSSTNNIRLMTRARAVGFRQMMLLGGGKTMLAMPFVLESFLIAGLSAAASWGIILYGQTRVAFTQFALVLPTSQDILLFCVACGVIGSISGYLGIRRLLK
jgi:cell division transport system permease protein